MRRLFPHRTEPSPDQGGDWVFWRWLDIWKTRKVGPMTPYAPEIVQDLYLTRLTLLRTPLFQVMLHWIHKPDGDNALHDHPWPFFAFILRGSYQEERWDLDRSGEWRIARTLNMRRWFNWINSTTPHCITACLGKVLTLVITGPKVKTWYFYQPDGELYVGCTRFKKIPWRDFISRDTYAPGPDQEPRSTRGA